MFIRFAVLLAVFAIKYFATQALLDAFIKRLDESVSQKHDDGDDTETPQSESKN